MIGIASGPVVLEGLDEEMGLIEAAVFQDLFGLLHRAGQQTVNDFLAYTGRMQPPIHPGGPLRPARLGNWADVSGDLARAYRYTVDTDMRSWADVSLINDDPGGYGEVLDKRGAYFVVRGAADPGGPLYENVREVVSKTPGWSIS